MQCTIGKQLRWIVSAGLGLWIGFEFGSMSVLGQQAPEGAVVGNVIFEDDFSQGQERWETTDEGSWEIFQKDGNPTFGLNKRVSDYQPKVRSPHNIALIKGVSAGDVSITFRVRSTLDTGNHRDCCVFLAIRIPSISTMCILGPSPIRPAVRS